MGPLSFETIRVQFVNFWSKRRARLDAIVEGLGTRTQTIDPAQANSVFDEAAPEVLLVGFGKGTRRAATFIADFKSSSWYRKVPIIAIIESEDEGHLWMCMEWGCDDAIFCPATSAMLRSRIRIWTARRLIREQEHHRAELADRYTRRASEFAEVIVPLGVAMMAETDFEVLLQMILREARRFCNADGGTIYLVSDANTLEFKIMVNESMGISYGAADTATSRFAPIPLSTGNPDQPHHIAGQVAVTGVTVNVEDVYAESRFDFSGAREFDRKTGYRTRSVLTIALRDKSTRVIGVLQLINSTNRDTGAVIPFDDLHQTFIESLSRLAGQALESYRKMARLRRQADALTISIDENERTEQVSAISSTDYFKELKAKASALRGSSQPRETASSS